MAGLLAKLKKLVGDHEPKRRSKKKASGKKKAASKKKMPAALREYWETKRR